MCKNSMTAIVHGSIYQLGNERKGDLFLRNVLANFVSTHSQGGPRGVFHTSNDSAIT